ncbi:hypothetical protein ES703_123078 [subsurface metagenome]
MSDIKYINPLASFNIFVNLSSVVDGAIRNIRMILYFLHAFNARYASSIGRSPITMPSTPLSFKLLNVLSNEASIVSAP